MHAPRLTKNWKAVIGFAGVLLTFVLTQLVDPRVQAILPHNWQVWLAAGGGAILTGVLAFLKRNPLTPEQVNAAVVNGDVTPDQLHTVAARHESSIVNDVGASTTSDLIAPVENPRPHLPPENHLG